MRYDGFGFRLHAAVVSVCVALGATATAAADEFYEATAADLQGPPGSVIRYLGIPRIQLTGAMVYRVLYRSTGLNGQPIAVSGIVMAPDRRAPAGGWPVIAWAHGTTGVARKCAPSLLPDPIASIPGINEMILHNFVVAATDYPGLGTAGEQQPHSAPARLYMLEATWSRKVAPPSKSPSTTYQKRESSMPTSSLPASRLPSRPFPWHPAPCRRRRRLSRHRP
jgi:hypothetical protein